MECNHDKLLWEFDGWARCADCGALIKIKEDNTRREDVPYSYWNEENYRQIQKYRQKQR